MIDVFLSEVDLLAQALCGNAWEHLGSVEGKKWVYAVATSFPKTKYNCDEVCTKYLVKDDPEVGSHFNF